MKIGHAQVETKVRGCVDCGIEDSRGWHTTGFLTVVIKKARKMLKHEMVMLHRCADCQGEVHV